MRLVTKIVSILLGMIFIISSNAMAMTFSQPIKIGRIYFPLAGVKNSTIIIENATYKASKSEGSFKGDVGYSYDRLTKFGNVGSDIYIHHNSRYGWKSHPKANFGDKNIKDTIELDISQEVKVFYIKNNSSIKFYILKTSEGAPSNIVLLGEKDGQWIKYFDTYTILKQYFGESFHFNSWAGIAVGEKSEVRVGNRFKHGLYCDDCTIIVEYEKNNGGKGPVFGKDSNEYGEFRFKWDDAAQWFGVEKVVY